MLQHEHVPADLVAVVALLGVSDVAMLAPGVRATPLRIPCGFLVALFLPGYVLTAVVFPERASAPSVESSGSTGATSSSTDATRGTSHSLDGRDRLVLSVAVSLVLVMATTLLLDRTGTEITLRTTLLVLNVVVVVGAGAATVRRLRLPGDRRPRFSVGDWVTGLQNDVASFDRLDRVIGVVVLVLLLVALGGTTYTALTPGPDERSTEFYLLAKNETGSFVGKAYPDDGRSRLAVAVSNREREHVNYSVVVKRQQVASRRASGTVLREQELYRFTPSVGHGVTWRSHHSVRIPPSENRSHTRLLYLLYRGSPPAEPTRANAYRTLYLWANSSDQSSTVRPSVRRQNAPGGATPGYAPP